MNKISDTIENKPLIGMICNCRIKPRLGNHMYPWMVRSYVLDQALQKRGFKLITYDPRDVNTKENKVSGYILDYNRFVKKTTPLPKTNYNFFIAWNNDDFLEFEKWALQNSYQIYPLKAIRKLASDKLLTATTLDEYKKDLVPKTEIFNGEIEKINKYLQKHNLIFIKPRFGSMGDDIFSIKRENDIYKIDFYKNAKIESLETTNLFECISFINKYSEDEDYIIQHGINSLQYKGSVFDIRAIVFKTDDTWQFLSEIRLSTKSSLLSNIAQGGRNYNTEDFFYLLFKNRSLLMFEKVKSTAIDIVNFLSAKTNCQINELALDIVLDNAENLHVVELNVKPGLAGSPKSYSNFFLMNPSESLLYENLTLKHGELLANSLITLC